MKVSEQLNSLLNALRNGDFDQEYSDEWKAGWYKALEAIEEIHLPALKRAEKPQQHPVAWWDPHTDTVSRDEAYEGRPDCEALYTGRVNVPHDEPA